MSVEVNFPIEEVKRDIDKRLERAQKKLDIQVLKDSNFYVPEKDGHLKRSGIANTVAGSGKVVWKTPYAKAQYYEHPNKSHQKNPNARMKWFEAAKANRKRMWEKLVNDEYHKNT